MANEQRTDTDRLSWCETNWVEIHGGEKGIAKACVVFDGEEFIAPTIREAIDLAMDFNPSSRYET